MRVLVDRCDGLPGRRGGDAAAARRARGRGACARSVIKAEPWRGTGIAIAPGALDDAASLKRAIADADAVINARRLRPRRAASTAILEAIAGTGKTFIHTSGISVTADRAAGAGDGIVRDETTAYQPIPERAARYAIDAEDPGRGGARLPPDRHVLSAGLRRAGVARPRERPAPDLVRDAREHGAARYVGPGEARWSHCHIDDIAEAYAVALAKGQAGALYYPENGEQSWGELAARIGGVLGVPDALLDAG